MNQKENQFPPSFLLFYELVTIISYKVDVQFIKSLIMSVTSSKCNRKPISRFSNEGFLRVLILITTSISFSI